VSILASASNSGANAQALNGAGSSLRHRRYEIRSRVDHRGAVEWFSGVQFLDKKKFPIRIGREPKTPTNSTDSPSWPSLAWEASLRNRAQHLGLPRVIDQFDEHDFSFLILEDPVGENLWDAWDAPNVGRRQQFAWLLKLADLIQSMHRSAAILEHLRPEFVRISPLGEVVLTADAPLIPLPPSAAAPVRPHLTSAPELIHGGPVDARADLYHFGAMLYALELGRELTDLDFEGPGRLRSPLAYDPDLHPCLGRLLARTLAVARGDRFPSDNAIDDLSGFGELIRTLKRAQSFIGRARLDIAAWTTTGMVRANNEDAVAIFHGSEQRDAAADDWAMIVLADGLGGNAAGEVAAAMTVQTLSRCAVPLISSRGVSEPATTDAPTRTVDVAETILTALRDANRAVYLAGRSENQHGMGCTADAVFTDGEQLVIGHVGDSRTYRFHLGTLKQLTHDQTYLAELFERRTMTVEEMRSHPRRSELTQAIGGRSTVDPEMIRTQFGPGDWLVVCSDGLTARVSDDQIVEILEMASSAEMAARRLINRANAAGAGDNVTVAVIRGC
jgi:serine/threonine protein phosphatase PrpC